MSSSWASSAAAGAASPGSGPPPAGSHDIDARVSAPPTVAAGTVYVPNRAGVVHAVDAASGTVAWRRRLGADGRSPILGTPVAVAGKTAYVGSLGDPTGVLALDAGSGEPRWTAETGRVAAGPAVVGGRVVVRGAGRVTALDRTGERRWSVRVPDGRGRAVALDDRRTYVPTYGGVVAVDRDGETAWRTTLGDGRAGPPVVAADTVLVRGRGRLTALARATGDERWTVAVAGSGRPVVTPTAVLTPADEGRLVALADG